MKKDAVLSKIKSEKVVALIRADGPDGLLDCAKALAEGHQEVVRALRGAP